MVALPGQLFLTTQIPACLWFLAKNKADKRYRDRRNEYLFIDARKVGFMVDRTRRDFADEDVARIANTYHAWRGESGAGKYEDVPGFCRSASLAEVKTQGFVLTPGRYVGAEEIEDDGEPFEEKMSRLAARLDSLFRESSKLETSIRDRVKGLGYEC